MQNLDEAVKSVARAELASAFDEPGEGPHVHDQIPDNGHTPTTEFKEISYIEDETRRVVSHSSSLTLEQVKMLQSSLSLVREGMVDRTIGTSNFRILVTHLHHDGRRYVEVLGLSRQPTEQSLARLRNQTAAILLVSLLALVWSAGRLSDYLTRPLQELIDQLGVVGATESKLLKPATEQPGYEVGLLYKSLNETFGRLDALMEAQKNFVSDASHEIRAPLTNLKVALEVCLRRERGPEEYREVLDVCHGEVIRLGKLADRLLTLTRLDSAQFNLHLLETDLSMIVKESLVVAEARAAESQQTLRIDLEDQPKIWCDSAAMRQVIDNLIDNALRHAPSGTTIEIQTRLTKENSVRISVTNSGCTLAPEQHSKVFDRFFRGDGSRGRATGGAGLGLSIVRGFVEAHGGEVGVESPEQGQISFWATIPLSPKDSSGTTERNSNNPI